MSSFHVLLLSTAASAITTNYFASTVSGLEAVLARELSSSRIGATNVREGRLGVSFSGDATVGARAVLWSRSALKVMELLSRGEGVDSPDDLYAFSREAVPRWDELLGSRDATISVQAVLGADRALQNGRARPHDWHCPSCRALVFASKDECYRCGEPKPRELRYDDAPQSGLTNTHYSALTVKNAVVDATREEHGWRPNVDAEDADLPLFLHVHRGDASLYRVLSGAASMHKRGYRTGSAVHVAALRETLAAGMLLHAGYNPESDVLCDPMAGSGTIPIEAALIATDTAPGSLRPPPALTRWPDSDGAALWRDVMAEARELRRPHAPLPILANDWHGGAVSLAHRGAQSAGVEESITFSESSAAAFAPSDQPNLIVTNPPWDGRLEGGADSWAELRSFLKTQCGGSRAWVLSGNKELTQGLRMKASSKLRIENAGTSLAFLEYDVLKPRGAAAEEVVDVPPAPLEEEVEEKEEEPPVTPPPAPGAAAAVAGTDEEAEDLNGLTVPALKELCREKGLLVGGRKAELILRLTTELPKSKAATAKKVKAAVVRRSSSSSGSETEGGLTMADGTGSDMESLFADLYSS